MSELRSTILIDHKDIDPIRGGLDITPIYNPMFILNMALLSSVLPEAHMVQTSRHILGAPYFNFGGPQSIFLV